MNILNKIWRIIISVFGFLIVWIFLPVFSIIGIYYQVTGKVPKKLQVGEYDIPLVVCNTQEVGKEIRDVL